MFFIIIIASVLIRQSSAVIYSVNESEYRHMPPLFAMDDYVECMLQPGGTYCLADYKLSSKNHSDLMSFIEEYSAYKVKHFDHRIIHRATCVTSTCKDYFTLNTTADLQSVLGRCTNETIWRRYNIEARLSELQSCKKANEKKYFDTSDYFVAAIYIVLIILNITGTFYDVIVCNNDTETGNPYLLAFSVKRNWSKLVAPGGSGPDPRLNRLKLFNGLRAMTMVCVIFSHSALIQSISYIANPLYFEKAYDDPFKHLIFNGTLVIHTFFVMSSFLLAYNMQIYAEKNKITWIHIPKGIFLRWIRLTPPYALILATISTLMRHVGSGPLWDTVVGRESDSCRQYWWSNILYFNNYVYQYNSCFPQAWYLAADTQLFCAGLVLIVIVQKPRLRKIVLGLLFLASLLIVPVNTYFENLDAVIVQSPETYRSLYVRDVTFNRIYISAHTNFSTYILGLASGLLTYHWQNKDKDFVQYKRYRWIIWLMFPLGVAVILSGGIFYIDGFTPPLLLRVVYAALYKQIFQFLVVVFIISSIFKIESLYRSIVEWRGFTWAGRVTYSTFLVHSIFLRGLDGIQTAPLVISDYFVLILLNASVFLSFFSGAILWLLVEAPTAGLTRALFNSSTSKDDDSKLNVK